MAASLRTGCLRSRICFNILSVGVHVKTPGTSPLLCRGLWSASVSQRKEGFLAPTDTPLLTQSCRSLNFFSGVSQSELWEGVRGVSNAGRKRGRSKRTGQKKLVNLNRGRNLGDGKANLKFPGLNTMVYQERAFTKMQKVPRDEVKEAQMSALQEKQSKAPKRSPPPLVRGWVGSRTGGQSHGPLEDVGDYKFEGFDSKIIEFRLVANMTGTLGKKMSFTAFIVCGNKKGLAGWGYGKSQVAAGSMKIARSRAGQNLMYVPLCEGRTVYHNMYIEYHHSKIYIHKKEKGYGLKCHRALKTVCEQIGIKDLHVKVEGATKNYKAIVKGFFEAIMNQETFQELADRTHYHVVERREDRDNLPVVVATPQDGKVQVKERRNEEEDIEMDYSRLYHGGRSEYNRPHIKRFYEDSKSFKRKFARMHKSRNQHQLNIQKRAGTVDTMDHFNPYAKQLKEERAAELLAKKAERAEASAL